MNEQVLELVRFYISVCRNQVEFSIDEAQAERAEEFFISKRAEENSVTEADLHAWLNLSRMVALSFHESSLTENVWNHMKSLEKKRFLRIKEMQGKMP